MYPTKCTKIRVHRELRDIQYAKLSATSSNKALGGSPLEHDLVRTLHDRGGNIRFLNSLDGEFVVCA